MIFTFLFEDFFKDGEAINWRHKGSSSHISEGGERERERERERENGHFIVDSVNSLGDCVAEGCLQYHLLLLANS